MLMIYERLIGRVVILDLSGKLHTEEDEVPCAAGVPCDSCALLRDRIRSLGRQGFSRFVVNLERVSHVDSLGLGSLISSKLCVERMGGRLTLLNPSDRLRRMLTLAKLLGRFEIFTSEREAISSFPVPAPVSGTDVMSAQRVSL